MRTVARSLRATLIGAYLLAVPLTALAQADGALEAQIRAELRNDPRSAALSEAEFNALVQSLATDAKEQGVSEAYLEDRSRFSNSGFSATPGVVASSVPSLQIWLSLAALVAILAFFIILRRHHLFRTPGGREL